MGKRSHTSLSQAALGTTYMQQSPRSWTSGFTGRPGFRWPPHPALRRATDGVGPGLCGSLGAKRTEAFLRGHPGEQRRGSSRRHLLSRSQGGHGALGREGTLLAALSRGHCFNRNRIFD